MTDDDFKGEPDDSSRAWQLAIDDGCVSYDFVFHALYAQYDDAPGSRFQRRAIELYPKLLSTFWATFGPIERSFYADKIRAGAVLCHHCSPDGANARDGSNDNQGSRDVKRANAPDGSETPQAERGDYSLFSIIWWDTIGFDADDARALFARLELLRTRVDKDLRNTPDHGVCVQFLYGIITSLIASLHREHLDRLQAGMGEPSARHKAEIRRLEERVRDAERAYQTAAQRIAQEHYFRGVVWGGAATLLLASSYLRTA